MQCSQNRPIKPATTSLNGFVVRLYHKMCFCRGNGSGSRGNRCQKFTVYLNGLPLSGTVRMCNHKEISVPNELAGLSKQKAWVALWFWNLYSLQERRDRQQMLFLFFDDCCDLLRQHSTVIFANVFNLHILVITRTLTINCMDSRQDLQIISRLCRNWIFSEIKQIVWSKDTDHTHVKWFLQNIIFWRIQIPHHHHHRFLLLPI